MTRETNAKGKRANQMHIRDGVTESPGVPGDWRAPVTPTAPCGPDLEYENDFVVLFAGTGPRQDAQYGSFIGSAEPINWTDVERDCRALLSRTRDIRLALLYTRCRTRLEGATGLAQGLGLLTAWLGAFPDQVHPCEGGDYSRTEALEMRMNALLGLVDPEGLLSDVRDIVLVKSTAARLQMRDIERAFAIPRPSDALASESVTQQLCGLRSHHPATMLAFEEALTCIEAIDEWCRAHLDEQRPDLAPMISLLEPLRFQAPEHALAAAHDVSPELPSSAGKRSHGMLTEEQPEIVATAVEDETSIAALPLSDVMVSETSRLRRVPEDRQSALESIRAARGWFEAHEPSSPIPVLLKRAEAFVGKRYSEVVSAIPPELLAEWDAI